MKFSMFLMDCMVVFQGFAVLTEVASFCFKFNYTDLPVLETVKFVMQFTHLNVRTSCVRSCDTSPTVNLISLNGSGRLEE